MPILCGHRVILIITKNNYMVLFFILFSKLCFLFVFRWPHYFLFIIYKSTLIINLRKFLFKLSINFRFYLSSRWCFATFAFHIFFCFSKSIWLWRLVFKLLILFKISWYVWQFLCLFFFGHFLFFHIYFIIHKTSFWWWWVSICKIYWALCTRYITRSI